MTGLKQFIGLDVGTKRTGLARASAAARLAEPLATVPTKQVLAKLQDFVANQSTEAIVIGRPRNMSGQETAQTRWVKTWVAELKKQLLVPLFWQDETLSSQIVEARGHGSKADSHAEAAAVILQDFLDANSNERIKI